MTKSEIIRRACSLACSTGLDEMSISTLAAGCDLRKSSLYSHFSSKQDIIDSVLEYCAKTLIGEIDTLRPEGSDALTGLGDTAYFLYDIFSQSDCGTCYRLIQSEKLRNLKAAETAQRITNMLTARVEVLLDRLSNKGKVIVEDTRTAAVFFCDGIENSISRFLMRQARGEHWDEFAWEVDRLCEGFCALIDAERISTR